MEKVFAFLVFLGLCYLGWKLVQKAKGGDDSYPGDDYDPGRHEDK